MKTFVVAVPAKQVEGAIEAPDVLLLTAIVIASTADIAIRKCRERFADTRSDDLRAFPFDSPAGAEIYRYQLRHDGGNVSTLLEAYGVGVGDGGLSL